MIGQINAGDQRQGNVAHHGIAAQHPPGAVDLDEAAADHHHRHRLPFLNGDDYPVRQLTLDPSLQDPRLYQQPLFRIGSSDGKDVLPHLKAGQFPNSFGRDGLITHHVDALHSKKGGAGEKIARKHTGDEKYQNQYPPGTAGPLPLDAIFTDIGYFPRLVHLLPNSVPCYIFSL